MGEVCQAKTSPYQMTLDIQTPAGKVFGPPKYTQTLSQSGSIWMCRAKERTPKAEYECDFVWGFHDFKSHFCLISHTFQVLLLNMLEAFEPILNWLWHALATSTSGQNRPPSETVFGLIIILISLW